MQRATHTKLACVAALALVALTAASQVAAMSIEAEPVKVTHRNSGPRYDIDSIERNRIPSANQLEATTERPEAPEAPNQDEGAPIGHVAIRRIFLFPMMRPGDWSEGEGGAPARDAQAPPTGREQEGEFERQPGMFAKPFWPFMTPARPSPPHSEPHHDQVERPHSPHLFGADEASRSPSRPDQDQASSAVAGPREQLPFDPIQMMMELMHQAIANQLATSPTDLNKDKDASRQDEAPAAESSDERPQTPGAGSVIRPGPKNETGEDIVEIDGKKYLRKTVTNRHVGENIIFMTRRLVFVPLNETDPTATPTTDTVATTGSDAPAAVSTPAPEVDPAAANRVGTNKPAATITTSAATPAASPSETVATEQAPTTTSQPETSPAASGSPASEPSEPSSTTASARQPVDSEPITASSVERATDAADKAAERLVEESPAKSTPAPVVSSEAAKSADA